jgi:uncharacterized membrane protein (Fun14 family)
MVDIDFLSIGASIGAGGVGGFLIGYFVKKMIKVVLFIAGAFVAALAFMEYRGIIEVNWDILENQMETTVANLPNGTSAVVNGTALGGFGDQLATTLSNVGIPLTGSFAAGFTLGFVKG